MKARKLMYILLGMFVVACTDSNSGEDGLLDGGEDNPGSVISSGFGYATSRVVSVAISLENPAKSAIVSLYDDADCKEANLLVDQLLVKKTTTFNFEIPAHSSGVYLKYMKEGGMSEAILFPVSKSVTRGVAESITAMIPEDAVQPTNEKDAGFRFFHSTGVAMFEDDWPKESAGFDNDFNDVVLEYDLKVTECQNDELLPAQGYKEGLLLTLDVRAKGGRYPTKVGVELIGLDKKYINEIASRIVLKGGQGVMDELKTGTTSVVVKKELGGIKYTLTVDATTGNPVIMLDGLTELRNPNGEFFQVSEGQNVIEVGRPMLRAEIQLTGKNRSGLSAIEGNDQLGAYRDLILDTKKQNFFIVAKNGGDREIHMKGYKPTRFYTTYDEDSKKGADTSMQSGTTYCNEKGFVWAMKVPVGTKHAYESKAFKLAYPNFLKWAQSNGAESQDWYLHPNMDYVVRYW